MKNLLIIGARGWGREVFGMLPDCQGYGTEFVVKGFLDDKVDALAKFDDYPPIIDSVEHYEPQEDDVFVCALGEPKWKRHYAQIMLDKGGKFINLVHKRASIGKNSVLGKGCIVSKDVSVSCDITIGDFVTIQRLTTIGHDAQIGDFCHISTGTMVNGETRVGEDCFVGSRSILYNCITVCRDVVIAAGSVVNRDITQSGTYAGNPIAFIK